MRPAARTAALLTACALAAPATALAADNPSLPHVASGARPGPDLLYAGPADAPQLEVTSPFTAPPILVSGATAYRDGEFLYQDFLHDDRGAAGTADPNDPLSSGHLQFKAKDGTLTYPTDPGYANNAADLVELRVKPLATATAFRVTLNAVGNPQRAAFTIAIGTSDAARAWPDSAGVSSPAQLFLTVHGDHAALTDAASGTARTPAPQASFDTTRRQITVLVPHAAWDPGRATVRLAAGVGLWDTSAGHYEVPSTTAATDTPGGAAADGAAIFNLAFRASEPEPAGPAPGVTLIDASVESGVNPKWWREYAQAQALAGGDVSSFSANVDFGKLADKIDDDAGIPTTGPIDRIVADRLDLGQGIDLTKLCGRQPVSCDGAIPEQLQAYTVYVPPHKPVPAGGYGLTLMPHALNENENEYDGSRWQAAMGDRGSGYLVVTPSSRGPDGDYTDSAEANVFTTWADVARHYRLDPDRTTIAGYSMGGGAVYRLMSRWPDLFARGAAIGAAPLADQTGLIGAMRNTPTLTWVESADEGTPVNTQDDAITDEVAHGLDFTFDTFSAGDHGTLPSNDEFDPFAAFLGDHTVNRDPAHVTYGLVPAHDFTRAGVVADHAYWLSGLTGRNAKAESTVDARSEAFGTADPVVQPLTTTPGVLQGGQLGPQSYIERREALAAPAAAPIRDRLDITATNLDTLTIDAARARVTCAPDINLKSDGPLHLTIDCTPGAVARAVPPGGSGTGTTKGAKAHLPACHTMVKIGLPRVHGTHWTRATVRSGTHVVARRKGKDLRLLRVRRLSHGAFTLRVSLTSAKRRGPTLAILHHFSACRVSAG